ncbi:DJ-1/PfpI family protein [Streptomyces sp. NPDC020141]|uniref:DJ-1/PfpI family protein n=1 Tax=Streptomyces sp. NPDC020141 TaxID=3365065 RepID=UPI00378A0D73
MTHRATRRSLLLGGAAAAALTAASLPGSAYAETPYGPGVYGRTPSDGSAPDGSPPGGDGPEIGILLYDGFSLLDATGPAEVLSRLLGARVTMIGERRGQVRTDTGDVRVTAERSIAETDRLDVLLVPGAGNRGTIASMENRALLGWIRRVHRHTGWTTSVCTGSLILAAAGLLDGRRATTYWASADYLRTHFDVTVVPERFVRSGKIVTAAGVSAGLDMALYLTSLIAGDTTAQAIQLAVEYDPRPPFDSGDATKADRELKELALRLLSESQV